MLYSVMLDDLTQNTRTGFLLMRNLTGTFFVVYVDIYVYPWRWEEKMLPGDREKKKCHPHISSMLKVTKEGWEILSSCSIYICISKLGTENSHVMIFHCKLSCMFLMLPC